MVMKWQVIVGVEFWYLHDVLPSQMGVLLIGLILCKTKKYCADDNIYCNSRNWTFFLGKFNYHVISQWPFDGANKDKRLSPLTMAS